MGKNPYTMEPLTGNILDHMANKIKTHPCVDKCEPISYMIDRMIGPNATVEQLIRADLIINIE
jgi:hypothetical protein